MKKAGFVTAILLLCSVTFTMQGQTLEQFKKGLAQPDRSYASRVEATEHGTAATTVRALEVHPSGDKISGYRVRIFLDNGQNARAGANGAIARFKEIYPDIPAYLRYKVPYFEVTVGNCLSSEEAIVLHGKIKDAFDRAVPVREEISLSLLGESPTATSPEESVTEQAN